METKSTPLFPLFPLLQRLLYTPRLKLLYFCTPDPPPPLFNHTRTRTHTRTRLSLSKRQVLKYGFLANLCETISLERLPVSAGGGCDPTRVTPDQVHDFVVCGRVAEVPAAGGDEGGSSGGGGTDEESGAVTPSADLEEAFDGDMPSTGQKGEGGVVGATASNGGGGSSRRGSSRRSSRSSSSGAGGGDGVNHKSGSKPHVTFRSLFERLQARDEPTPAAPTRLRSPPLSRTSSFQERSSFSSPPLSRHGSSASLVGGASARPFVSPGPRGLRRATTAGVGEGVGGGDGDDDGDGDGTNGDHSPIHGDEHAEDFDSRLVGRALRLSMKRKVHAFCVCLGREWGWGWEWERGGWPVVLKT